MQLFSVRNEAEKDFYGTLQLLKGMGYQGVELAGTYELSFEEIRAALEKSGLKAVSAHVSGDDIDSDEILSGYQGIGVDYLAVQGFGLKPEKGAMEWCANRISGLGERCRSRGIQLLYHNHRYEFDKMNGKNLLDVLYESTSPELLKTEIDLAWAGVSGENPAEYLRKYPDRCPLVHLKDYYGEHGTDSFELRCVGCGVLDVPAILSAATDIGTEWIVVEQDSPSKGKTPLECARTSITNLNTFAITE